MIIPNEEYRKWLTDYLDARVVYNPSMRKEVLAKIIEREEFERDKTITDAIGVVQHLRDTAKEYLRGDQILLGFDIACGEAIKNINRIATGEKPEE